MAVKDGIYIGELTLRGGAYVKREINTISLLEIGEHSLRNVKATELMMNYVDRAAEQQGVCVIGIQSGLVVAVGQHGVSKDGLEEMEEATKRVKLVFWILFVLAALSIVLAPVTVPLGLWCAFVSWPRRKLKLLKLISEVQATTVNLKEGTH